MELRRDDTGVMIRTALGIDVGTSKVAAAIVRVDGAAHRTVLCTSSIPHHADLATLPNQAEQDVGKLWQTTLDAIHQLDSRELSRVQSVAFCGQMHGCVVLDRSANPITNAITWRDQRTGQPFIDELCSRRGHRLFAGQAMVNLAFMQQRRLLPEAACAVNVMDYFGMKLSGGARGFIDPTNANAWGLLRLPELQWDFDAIERCSIPRQLLPTIVPSGATIGHVGQEMSLLTGIQQGANICVSSGDHQASVLGCLSDPEHQIALNLGSGGQCTIVAPREFPITAPLDQPDHEIRPFFEQRFLICTAVLAGGIAWRWLADSLRAMLHDLEMGASESLSDNALFGRLNELGAAATASLAVDPRFCGERSAQNARGTIAGIDLDNFRIGPLARGLAEGIIANLKRGLPGNVLINKTSVCLTGNAFRRNPVLCTAAERVFGLPVILSIESEEAATGAALLAMNAS